jgi:hypothetical protein
MARPGDGTMHGADSGEEQRRVTLQDRGAGRASFAMACGDPPHGHAGMEWHQTGKGSIAS